MTLQRTGKIRFNLAERGRTARGVERHFDTAAAARLINSPAVQEKIKHGDMVGYFGHWPRVQFGLNASEGGVVNGQAISVEPNMRLVHCVATPDGWVEHETEFFDNTGGKIAARCFGNKVGGFSSAIRAPTIGGRAVPTEFHGFDYVIEPNYSTNRGYGVTLDGIADGDEIFDAVAERNLIIEQCSVMLDSMQSAYDQMAATMARMGEENAYYLSRLAAQGTAPVLLDGVLDVVSRPTHSYLDSAESFLTENLVGFQPVKEEPVQLTDRHRRQLNRYGV